MTTTKRESMAIVAGPLMWGHLRDLLNVLKLRKADIDWHEGTGIFSRTFYIRGSQSALKQVRRHVKTH